LFVIEGLKIDLTPFITVEKDHKVAIIKKLLAKKDKSKGFTSNIIENYEKKAMKKCDFHFLLRNFWVKETSNVFESIVGENLTCLF
jgi:predicted CopG family antitoxin